MRSKINSAAMVQLPQFKLKSFNLNFGPQHPAAHGVLRLLLKLNNEVIVDCDPHIGLLHRGTEKLMESKIYINSLPYFDRLDYVSTLLQEHAYALCIETMLQKKVTNLDILRVRTVFDELTRALNHYLAIACHALDVGSMSPIFWAFEDREKIMEFYEYISGARMHTAMYKPLLQNRPLNGVLKKNILGYIVNGRTTLNEIHNSLTTNKVWKLRLRFCGVINHDVVENFSITGPMLRSMGIKKDIRVSKHQTYSNYKFLNFNSYTTKVGDSYDRFLLRMYEINESYNIIGQNLINRKADKHLSKKARILNKATSSSMEGTISHFKYWSSGFDVKNNILYRPVESPKGEFGVTLISDDSAKPYRCKVRSPSFFHLFLLKHLAKNLYIADLIVLIGTIDIVFGEVDR